MTLACPKDFFISPEDAAPLETGENGALLICQSGWELREFAADIPLNWCQTTCSSDETQAMCDQDICQCTPSAAFNILAVVAIIFAILQL